MIAYWWYERNFGDALNPYLLEKLSGKKVCYTPAAHVPDFRKEWVRFIKSPLSYDWRRLGWPEKKKPVVLAIGSRLEDSRPNYHVWGAGFLNSNGFCKGGTFWAVRGSYSAQRLVMLGFPRCEVYGDPALLMPMVYQPNVKKEHRVGIVPHIVEYKNFCLRFPHSFVVNLATNDIEHVIDEIYSCDLVLSTSLHGMIVAHAYGIPALWIKDGSIAGDNIKFKDYLSSVSLPYYDGRFSWNDVFLSNGQVDEVFVRNAENVLLPSRNKMLQIQKQLLAVAPFPIKISRNKMQK